MAKGKVSSLFDFDALTSEQKKAFGILDALEEKMAGMAKVKISISGSGNFKELSVAQVQYNSYIKETANLVKQLADTEAKLVVMRQAESAQLVQQKQRLQELTKEQKERIRIQNAEKGSIEELSLKYDKAYRIYKKLSEEQRGTERGQGLNKFLNDTNIKLKELEGNVGQFRRNVGNYAGSLAKPFESLQKTLDKLKSTDLKSLGGPTGSAPRDASREAASRQLADDLDKIFIKASREGATAAQQVKLLEAAFQKLSLAADPADKEMKAFLDAFKKEVGEAKDAVQDLKDEIKLNASDTKGIDNVIGSLNALAGIAQGAAGAYALLGANEEDAAKVTSKLIAVQGIANSIQQVGAELTKQGTLANKAYVFVQGLVATATNTTATATARLNAVLKLSTIGLVVAAVGALVYILSSAGEKIKSLTDRQVALNDAFESSRDTVAEAIKNVFDLRNNIELARQKFLDKEIVVKQYNETIGQTTGQVKTLDEAEKELNKNAEAYIQYTLLKAEANYALSEAAKEAVNAQVLFSQRQQQIDDARKASGNGLFSIDYTKIATESSDKALNDATKRGVTLFKLFEDLSKRAAQVGKDFTGPNVKVEAEKVKTVAKALSELLSTGFERFKIDQERELEMLSEIADSEQYTYQERLRSLNDFIENKNKLSQIQEEVDKADAFKKYVQDAEAAKGNQKELSILLYNYLEQVKLIEAKANDERIKNDKDFNKRRKKVIEDGLKEGFESLSTQVPKSSIGNLQFGSFGKSIQRPLAGAKDQFKNFNLELYSSMVETFGNLSSVIAGFYDDEAARMDERKKRLEADTALRIEQIKKLGLSEEETKKRITAVEKQAAFETEQIEKKKRKMAVERARFEKIANIASIISSTAQAVVGALGQKPWSPLNIALAVAVGAIGALQLARAISAPIPQYRKGTSSAKRGPALVSEEGSELMERGGKLYLTPDRPAIMEMIGGEKITPAMETKKILAATHFSKMSMAGGVVMINPTGMTRDQADDLIGEIKSLKRVTERSRIAIYNQAPIETSAYYMDNIKH